MVETDPGTLEDERDPRPMGVIRKKTASRGTEAGTKYHCDICSVDVTSTVQFAIRILKIFASCRP